MSLPKLTPWSGHEVLFPALNQSGGWAIFISTFKGKNHFYKQFSQYWDWSNSKPIEDPNFRCWYLPASRNVFFTEAQRSLAKQTMPPAQYDQEYECLPMSGVSNVFPSLVDLMTGSLKVKELTHYYSMGVDLAKYKDYTSVSIIDRNTHHLVFQERWQGDWGTTIEKIILYERNTIRPISRLTLRESATRLRKTGRARS